MQQRLTDLHFFPGPVDGQFGNLTRMAVWAFEKLVLGVPSDEPTGVVTNEMWQRMQDPIAIEPLRHSSEGQATEDHTEVYLPQQVVAFFVDDEPVLISHMSSGTGQEVARGRHHRSGGMGQRARHGGDRPRRDRRVGHPGRGLPLQPLRRGHPGERPREHVEPRLLQLRDRHPRGHQRDEYPASHGCIRVPLKVGEVFHQYVHKGDQVFVFDGEHEPENEGSPPPIFNRVDPDYTTTTTTAVPTTTQARSTAVAPVVTRPATTQPPATTAPPPVTTQLATTQPPATTPTPSTTRAPATAATTVAEPKPRSTPRAGYRLAPGAVWSRAPVPPSRANNRSPATARTVPARATSVVMWLTQVADVEHADAQPGHLLEGAALDVLAHRLVAEHERGLHRLVRVAR